MDFFHFLVPKLLGFWHSAIVASSPHPRRESPSQRSHSGVNFRETSPARNRHQNGWDSKVWSQLNHCVWPLRFEMHIGPSATPTSRVTKMRSPFGAENKRSSFLNGWKSLNIYKDRLHTTKKVESFCGARLAKTTQEVNLANSESSSQCCLEPSFSHIYKTTWPFPQSHWLRRQLFYLWSAESRTPGFLRLKQSLLGRYPHPSSLKFSKSFQGICPWRYARWVVNLGDPRHGFAWIGSERLSWFHHFMVTICGSNLDDFWFL